MTPSYEFIECQVSDYVATVRINRPPVNAASMGLYRDMVAVFADLTDRNDVRAAILTGTGKYFCAGRDVKMTGEQEPPAKRHAAARQAYSSILHCEVPVVGAINGAALGAGFAMALNCDVIVGAETATFGWPEIDMGLSGGIAISHRVFNPFQLRKLAFTGQRIGAQKLFEMGVLDSVVAADELISTAMDLATTLASKPPLALRSAKWLANEVELVLDYEQASRTLESRVSFMLGTTADHKEAVAAFKEKRSPVFRGA